MPLGWRQSYRISRHFDRETRPQGPHVWWLWCRGARWTKTQILDDQLIDSSFEVKEEDIESYKPLGYLWIALERYRAVSRFSLSLVWKLVSVSWSHSCFSMETFLAISLQNMSNVFFSEHGNRITAFSTTRRDTASGQHSQHIVEQGKRLSRTRQLFCGLLTRTLVMPSEYIDIHRWWHH